MKRLTALLLALILVLSSAVALADTWFCPECGTKCDGNFCPNCGTKKPDNVGTGTASASGMKVEKVVLNTDGSVTISWSGGKAPYKLSYQWYVNEDHNLGADVIQWLGADNVGGTRYTLDSDLVPGERYWLIITDSTGSKLWYDYRGERRTFNKYSSSRMVFTLRSTVNKRSSNLNSFTANEIERGYLNNLYGATIKMDMGRLATDYVFYSRMALFLPNGEPILFYVSQDTYYRGSSYCFYETLNFRSAWSMIMEAKGEIPTGRYTYRFYADDSIYGEQSFEMN